MNVITTIKEMQAFSIDCKRNGRSISLVPTMGFLHEGHLSLVRRARTVADIVVVSIYVNPVQFAPGEDFDKYPRDQRRDLELCEDNNVDIVFIPDSDEMYGESFSTYVNETLLSTGLCGRSRPSHFKGVVTVVAKLFNIILPDIAIFGQKDAQQARVIERMTEDLNFPVNIVVAPIVREADGLAMSSRNIYLSSEERKKALALYHSICLAEQMYADGIRDAKAIKNAIIKLIEKNDGVSIEYVETVSYDTLEDVNTLSSKVLTALAVKVGNTRLIDNVLLG